MSNDDAMNNIRKARGASKGKKIFIGLAGFFIFIVIVGAVAGKSSSNSSSSSSSTVSTTSTSDGSSASGSTDDTSNVPASNWYPAGFYPWSDDPTVAFRWAPAGYSCAEYEDSCYKAIFISENGCPTQFYAAINLLDSDGNVINYSNADLPSLLPMQKATLDFDDIDGTSKSAQMATITCN